MDYDSMSTAAIKSLLIDVMKERETLHYVIGWLRSSYCSPTHEDIERAVAIKQLKAYEEQCSLRCAEV